MELPHYPYRFVQRFDEESGSLSFLRYKLLYTFKSTRSHQWYWVWVEAYDLDFYAIKFHLKAHRDSENKYRLLTGLNEARPVIYTCMAILNEIAESSPQSSFGFIGANLLEESTFMTKRLRVYSSFMATYFTESVFEHYMMIDKSAYLLVRRQALKDNPDLLTTLSSKFNEMYEFFD